MAATRQIPCPQCGGNSVWGSENPFRPFCSERCKLIDLGAWASEAYRVPVQAPEPVSPDSPGENPA